MARQAVTPHSLEAEQALLGAVLVRPESWAEAAMLVRREHFFRSAHQTIWDAMSRCVEKGVAIDLLTVGHEMGAALGENGGPAYLLSLVDGVPRSSNISHYAGIVVEQAQLRRVLAIGEKLREDAHGRELTAREVADSAMRALSDVTQDSSGGIINVQDAVDDYVRIALSGETPPRIPTGFADLDGLTGGLKSGDLVIVAGRPSSGKSSLGLGVARHVARVHGASLFFSLEMGIEALSSRLVSWASGVPHQRIDRGTTTAADNERIARASAAYELPLAIETSAKTVTEIGARCRSVLHQGLTCAVVDYLQLLMPDRRRESEEAEIASISHALKRLAKDLKIGVIALSQLNRAPEGRKDKRPTIADLRGSGALEQDADMAWLVFREEMYAAKPENQGIAEVIVAKNRNGPTGVVRLAFRSELAKFDNLATQGSL